MVGPHKQFDIEDALDKAIDVFWRQGYELTSIQDLVNGMGINRASLYDTFGNKTDLYKKALQRYINQVQAETRELLFNSSGTVDERLMNYFINLGESHQYDKSNAGCFVNNTAVELGPHYPEIAELVRSAWNEMEDIFRTFLDSAVEKKELPPDTDTAAIAATINMTIQGISVLAKAGTPYAQLAQIIGTVLGLLKPN